MEYDLIALGETMTALAPPPGDTIRTASVLQIDHAGAESNTCVGLARLGLRVAWISRLGADAAAIAFSMRCALNASTRSGCSATRSVLRE